MRKKNKFKSCPGPEPCGHSQAEHDAFDGGLRAGEHGAAETACTFRGNLREAWLTGHSVGVENRNSKKQKPLTRKQLVANFRLLLELSPRNSYEEYRAAVREIVDICTKGEA